MRYCKLLIILALSVFLFGNVAAVAADGNVPGQPFQNLQNQIDDHETRLDIVEDKVADHETRIGNEESNNTGQNQRLDSLEQEQEVQNSRLDALESQPPTMAGIKGFDSSEPSQFVGLLVSIVPEGYRTQEDRGIPWHFTIFIPSAGKFAELEWYSLEPTQRTTLELIYFDEPGCSGNAYIPDGADPADPYNLLDDYFLYYHIRTKKFYKRGEMVAVTRQSKLSSGGNCVDETDDNELHLLVEVDMPFNLPLRKPLRFE